MGSARTDSLANADTPQMHFHIYHRLAMFLAQYVRGQVDPAGIYSQVRTQSLNFAGVTVVLTAVVVVGSYIPALRAMRLDPITTFNSR